MAFKPRSPGSSYSKVELLSSLEKLNHVCEHHHFKTVDQQQKEIKRRNTECTHGENCFRTAENRCWFKHSQPLNILPHQEQGENRQATSARHLLYCKYQETSFKGLACKFKHFHAGFLLNQHPLYHQ